MPFHHTGPGPTRGGLARLSAEITTTAAGLIALIADAPADVPDGMLRATAELGKLRGLLGAYVLVTGWHYGSDELDYALAEHAGQFGIDLPGLEQMIAH